MRSGASSLRWIRLIIRAPLSDATISYSLRIYGEACLAVFPGLSQDALQAAKPKSKSLGDPRPREGICRQRRLRYSRWGIRLESRGG